MAKLSLRVIPRSLASRLSIADGKLRAHLQSPPIDGRANDELVQLVATSFGLRRADVTLVRGAKSRDKVVELSAVSEAQLQSLLREVEQT